jgi:exopolysaccharide biosynthesis WecB/TagA/CpsF family protein
MSTTTTTHPAINWPAKYDLFGVKTTATHYDEVVALVIRAAVRGIPATADFMPVHGLVCGSRDPKIREALNGLDIVACDGQPVRWALNLFYKTGLKDRVYGPELTIRVCKAAAEQGVPIYLYGGVNDALLDKLKGKLLDKYPALKFAGAESPPFRALSPEEDAAAVKRINDSGAGIVLVGLGCPKQELFAYEHRTSIKAVQLCVGAAFDFHAGEKKTAPGWMQRRGLEWLFRLIQEPRRLWKRYLVTNTMFSLLVGRRVLIGR